MDTFSDVIDAFKSFADAIGVPESHARTMKARNSIPPAYWLAVVGAAEREDIQGVSLELLARLSAQNTQRTQKDQASQHQPHGDDGATSSLVETHGAS